MTSPSTRTIPDVPGSGRFDTGGDVSDGYSDDRQYGHTPTFDFSSSACPMRSVLRPGALRLHPGRESNPVPPRSRWSAVIRTQGAIEERSPEIRIRLIF
jgi:hypothetical protein